MEGMRAGRAGRWVWALVAIMVASAALAGAPGALANEASPSAGGGLASEAGSALMQPVGAGQQAAEEAEAARAARLSSPEALAEDARSRLEYSGYGKAASIGLAKRLFGLGDSASHMPQDQGTAKITNYLGEDAAAETLPDGKHLLLDASMPLRSAIGSGQLAPVSLSLSATGSGYEPANPLVPVVIGKNAAEGVSFEPGLRVAPAQHAEPESSEVVGDGLFYPGVAKDTDFSLEAAPDGVEASWQILSAEGSAENSLSFTLPAGASLMASDRVTGAVEVMLEGRSLLRVMPAEAVEANGAILPVTYSIKGNTLTTHVDLEGNVDLPVLVDPLISQEYGGGSKFWSGWGESGTEGAYFLGGNGNEGVLAGIDEGYAAHAWAAREIYAPGWSTGEGSITRVDVRNLGHHYGPATHLETGIVGGGATSPVWTFNGTNPAETHGGQLNTGEELEGKAAAFCAVGAGGYDGGPTPLCNEGAGGQSYHLSIYAREARAYTQWVIIEQTWVKFIDASNLTAGFNVGSSTAGGYANALSVNGEPWFGPASANRIEYAASDSSFGVERLELQRWTGSAWETIHSNNYAAEGQCPYGITCTTGPKVELSYEALAGRLPNGTDRVRVLAVDPSGIESASEAMLRVDGSKPADFTVTGADVSGSTVNITEGEAGDQITVSASSGEGGVPSSGIASMWVQVDTHKQGGYEGSCYPGPCTAKATWTLSGRELGAGVHKLTVSAKNGAGWIESAEYTLIVHAAAPLAMGPGSVNPQSGDFALESADVDLKDSAGDLTVTRHYDSRNVKEGVQGPLGPQWTIGLGELASLEVIESEGKVEGVMVVGPEGLSYFPAKTGGGFESPPGDSSVSLTLVNNGSEYVLEDQKKGTSTTFTKAGSTNQWMPTVSKTTVATNTLTDTYTTVEAEGKAIVEPTEELAPHSTAKCPAERQKLLADEEAQAKACRALFFYYGSEHSGQPEAKGEGESEWGWHANRLTQVVAVVWSTAAEKMEEEAVAEYSYDGQGRLRAVWDPRVKPALKTVYGYDSEGHVTAISPPGQQPWLMSYGTTPEDPSAGRLLKVTRAKASAALWNGSLPVNKVLPEISGSPQTGVRLAASTGEWSNAPVVYGFQWERCTLAGEECSAIPGAVNANYTPVQDDVGRTLVVEVSATNAGGTTVAVSAQTSQVGAEIPTYSQQIDSSVNLGAVSCMSESTHCVVGDANGKMLYTNDASTKTTATWNAWAGPGASPADTLDCEGSSLCLLLAGKGSDGGGEPYYATELGGAWSKAFDGEPGVTAISCKSICAAADHQHLIWTTSPTGAWREADHTAANVSAVSCVAPEACVFASKENMNEIDVALKISNLTNETWVASPLGGGRELTTLDCISVYECLGIAAESDAVTEFHFSPEGRLNGGVGHVLDEGAIVDGLDCAKGVCVAVDNRGNVYVSTNSGNTWTHELELAGSLTSVSCTGGTLCVAAESGGIVATFDPTGDEEARENAPLQTPQPGTTIEYNVPVSGSGAPYPMSAKDVEAWGQNKENAPVEAAEIFPEEHPQGWPASGHAGATVYYTDDEAETVNLADPAGGIATTEYHEGDVVRALSADNRERALKEANPVAAADKLATVSKYNEESNELTEVTGPEHKVKLANGEEVSARNHVRYWYDQGAPENEKGEVEEYGLVTKTTDGALLANGEEKDVRTTLTGYSGQEGLGWRLRQPTSTTVDPTGLDLVSSTKYNTETGAVEETRAPGGNAETVSPPEPAFSFGSEGSGNGQFNYPQAVAVAPGGDIWVDDKGKSRLEVFSSAGSFIAAYGSAGSGEGQFKEPADIAINKTNGNVYVADTQNERVEELNSEGRYVRAWSTWTKHQGESGPEKLEQPVGITVDPAGHVWVSNYENGEIEEFTETGEFIRQFGGKGAGDGQFEHPRDLTFSQGMLYVVDDGNKRIEVFTPTGQYVDQFGGPALEGAWGIAAAPVTGDLYVSDEEGNDISEFSPAGKYFGTFSYWGSGVGKLSGPAGLAVNAAGELFVADQNNNRVSAWRPAEAGAVHVSYSTQFGSEGSGEGQIEWPAATAVDPTGDVWVTDNHTSRVEKFSSQGKFLAEFASAGSEEKQLNGPTGIAINQATSDIYIGDCNNHRVQERNTQGEVLRNFTSEHLNCPDGIAIDSAGNVWVADSGADEIEEFSASGSFLHAYGSKGSGDLQFAEPSGIAIADEKVYVSDTKNNRIQELSLSGEYLGQFGSEGSGGGQFEDPEGIAADSAGDLFISDTRNNRIEELSPSGHYLESISQAGHQDGQLNVPQGLAITAAGDIYVADGANHRVEKWAPDSQAVHDTRTIYYSPGNEAGVEACENKPQWAGLACRTEPVAQPTDSAAEPKGEQLPELPVVTTEYNMWYEPVKTTETIGNTTRTKTTSYEAERVKSQSIEAGAGKAVPSVSDKYSATTGALLEQQSEGAGQETKTITQHLNTLGQLESYTDAEGNATTYTYDQYGRPEEINYDASKLDGLTDIERLRYDETTGQLNEIEDLGGEGTYKEAGTGTYKASHGIEGELLSETYPNNMTATYSYNSIGEGTSLSYLKNNNCSGSECEWFHDTRVPSIHGEALVQESSLAKTSYSYDTVGRLAEAQETPTGQDCIARIYGYDEEGDRTSLTTRLSGSGECTASEGGSTERHTYDEANRNTDEGVQYEPLGNITKVPAADAGGHELSSEYYANGQVLSQTQDETTNSYLYDPEGRTRQTETIIKLATAITIAHYPGPGGSAPSWTYNQTAGTITRNVAAFGGLAAVEEAGKEPLLQIRDLQGNIVGTAQLSETAGKPHTLERSTEYGVPTTEKPEDKYNWLGSSGITSNLPSGTIAQDGATYVPQLGATLQTKSTPEPAVVVNTDPPAVMTVTPFVALKYEEAAGNTGEAATPTGNVPEPEGEGTTSGIIGDPVHCEVYADNPVQEEEVVETSKVFVGVGGFNCRRKVPKSTWLKLCFLEYGNKELKAYCHTWKVGKTVVVEEELKWEGCSVGVHYALGAWLWHYHEPALFALSKNTTACQADNVEEGIEDLTGKLKLSSRQ